MNESRISASGYPEVEKTEALHSKSDGSPVNGKENVASKPSTSVGPSMLYRKVSVMVTIALPRLLYVTSSSSMTRGSISYFA